MCDMARQAKFFLKIATDRTVGPHTLNMLRKWVYFEVIPRDAMVCEEGKERWLKISDVPDFLDFPDELKKLWSSYEKPHWWSDPVTEKQIKKLDYFGLPYSRKGLTKGRASQLIECFIEIDQECEKQYQDRPATAEQKRKLRALGDDSGLELTYSEARDSIEELELEKRAQDEEEEMEMMVLENSVNDEDWRELLGYKKLNQKQLEALARYLKENPQFKEADRDQLAKIVIQLFPELERKSRGQKKTRAQKTGFGGCLVLLIAGSIVWAVISSYFAGSSSSPPTESVEHRPKPGTPAATNSITPSASQPLAGPQRPGKPGDDAQAAQRRAVAAFPALGVKGSPLNREFLRRYGEYQRTRKALFNDPEWPTKLAAESQHAIEGK